MTTKVKVKESETNLVFPNNNKTQDLGTMGLKQVKSGMQGFWQSSVRGNPPRQLTKCGQDRPDAFPTVLGKLPDDAFARTK